MACPIHAFRVRDACMNKQFCFLDASDRVFGNICDGTVKRLAVQVSCAAPSAAVVAAVAMATPNATSATAMSCYTDEIAGTSSYTTATAASLGAFAKLAGTAAAVLDLVPFLMARQGRRGAEHGVETSGWMTGFMLEGLYRAAGETGEGRQSLVAVAAAVEYCHATLTNTGLNSWLSMIAQNATMTMESWIQAPTMGDGGKGGGTFSHPWTAAPARIIPRFTMGVRPSEDGWRTIAVRPLPAKSMTSASLDVLTLRGPVKLAFTAGPSTFALKVTVPGNTVAEVCLPRYLFAEAATCIATVGGTLVAADRLGGLLCLTKSLGGGVYQVEMTC